MDATRTHSFGDNCVYPFTWPHFSAFVSELGWTFPAREWPLVGTDKHVLLEKRLGAKAPGAQTTRGMLLFRPSFILTPEIPCTLHPSHVHMAWGTVSSESA